MNKWILGFTILLLGIGGTVFFFLPNETYDEDEPLELFQQQQFAESLQSLDKNRKAFSQSEYLLQKSYILREIGECQEAENCLLKIVQKGSNSPSILSETYLNIMLSDYQAKDWILLKKELIDFQRFLQSDREWLSLFMGISFYHDGDSGKALDAFVASSARGYQSPWMEQRFSKVFDSHWYAKHYIHSLIGVGKVEDARRMLEKMKLVFTPEYSDEHNYLYGLTYIAEAEKQPYDLAIPYYRLATGYLSRVRDYEFIAQQKEELVETVGIHMRQILAAQDFDQLPFYVQMFEKWGGDENIQELKDLLIVQLDQGIWDGQDEQLAQLVDTLSFLLKDSKVRHEIALRFEYLLELSLQKEETDLLPIYWNMLLAFREEDEQLNGKFSDLAIQKVLQSIVSDDSKLSRTSAYIDFYLLSEGKDEHAHQLAENLVKIAERYWGIPEQRQKSIELLKAAKRVVPQPFDVEVQASIEELFKYRYTYALKQDLISELFDLMTAVDTLEVASVDLQDRQEMQQQLEDAEFLYLNGRLSEAEKKAEWVLTVDPDNLRARRLLGMIAYYFADYQKAAKYLNNIPPANDEMREAHAVVAILSGNKEQGIKWLKEVEQNRPIQEQIYLRLAYGLLEKGEAVEALEWLEKVPETHSEVLPARVYAAFQMNSWNETIDLFEQLEAPYEHLDGYHGLVVDSQTALGEEKAAEQTLDGLLRKPPQPDESNFSPHFQAFKQRTLDQWNRFFVAGLYFKIVRNDPENALRYFNKIEDPSMLAQVEKAEVYFQLGRLHEAKELMLQIDQEITEDQLEIKLRILPLLGMGFEQLGYYVESIPFYEEYFKLKPDDDEYRYFYVRVLMRLKRYDLALAQVKLLREQRPLTVNERIAWLQILLHKGEFELVDNLANQWLSNEEVPLLSRLQLARMMVVTKNQSLLEYILKGIPEPSQRSVEDNQELIRLWMDQGEYAKALDLSQLLEKKLMQTEEGLMVLAELYMKLSRQQEALSYAEKVLQINSTNVDALEFIDRYEQRADVIAPLVKLLKERVEENPDNVTLQIDYAKNLIELAMEAYLAGAITNINDSVDLQQARLILEKLKDKQLELPEVHLLSGKVYFLVDLNQRAQEEFEQAIKYDPSYIEALQHLALVYEGKGQLDQAINAINNASKFAPSNADVWEQIGNLYVEKLDWKKAVDAYQNSIRFAPFDPDPYLRLASTYLTVKKPVDAVKTLEGLLAITPQNSIALSLMLQALYDPAYVKQDNDPELLQRVRIDYYDLLKSIDPDLAKKSLPEGVSLEP